MASQSSSTRATATFKFTERQLEAHNLLRGHQRHTLLVGGARSGKTLLFCRSILARALSAPGSRHLIARLHFNHVRATIWLDTLPKTRDLCFPDLVMQDKRADNYVLLPCNGSEIWFGGLDERDRVDKILGSEYATIFLNEVSQIPYSTVQIVRTRLAQKVERADGRGDLPPREYDDLNPTGRRHWTYLEYVQKRNPSTNRPLAHPDEYQYLYMNPYDNRDNLPQGLIDELEQLPERQRMRFLEGEYSAEIDPQKNMLQCEVGHTTGGERASTLSRPLIPGIAFRTPKGRSSSHEDPEIRGMSAKRCSGTGGNIHDNNRFNSACRHSCQGQRPSKAENRTCC